MGQTKEEVFTSPASWSQHKSGKDEQFTGLQDKNGVEIYEGDILEAGFGGPEVVLWDQECCCFATRNVRRGEEEILCQSFDGWEVIGNVHQNPELLKIKEETE